MDGLAANLARAQEAISRARTLSVQLQVRVTAGSTNQREPEQPGQVELPPPLQLSETSATGIQGTSEQAYDSMQGARQDALQPAQEVHSRQEHDAWQERAGSSVQAGSGPYSARISPMLLVAQKLSLLQRQQSNTMQQLMLLRLEQVRSRVCHLSIQMPVLASADPASQTGHASLLSLLAALLLLLPPSFRDLASIQLSLRQQQLTALGELLRVEVQAVEGTPQQVHKWVKLAHDCYTT